MGWISDIHAGSASVRNEDSKVGNIQEPKKYAESLNSVLSEMKKKSIDTVVVSGDMLNLGEKKYVDEMKKIAKKYKMNMIWVKGNHDKKDAMKKFGSTYFYKDYGNTRIIVLDNTSIYNDFYGDLPQEQIDWLKQSLVTSNDVVISMHIPIFSRSSEGRLLLDRYKEFENIISTSGNVKLVLFGHFHENYETELNGVKYKILQPLTKKNENRSYGIVDLDNYSVNYTRAKSISYNSGDPRTVKISRTKAKNGVVLKQRGSNFSKKTEIQLFFSKADGSYELVKKTKTDKKGKFSVNNKIVGKSPGKYNWYALDTKTNKKSKKSYYTVVK
ncbi:MAG: metallophosphoesterase [Candidatus Moranbacteria bacterium]|nr:metallophosphoesterase [Candidatus Moranbacteria bacterium]